MNIESSQIVYSEHGEDECFEHKDGRGRVPEGCAVGYTSIEIKANGIWVTARIADTKRLPIIDSREVLILFDDIKYSEYDHKYWDDYELEHDQNRVVI